MIGVAKPEDDTVKKSAQEIADDLAERIRRGEWLPGAQLPPYPDLQKRYGDVSHATVQRAMGLLRYQGLVEYQHGRGNYVKGEQ